MYQAWEHLVQAFSFQLGTYPVHNPIDHPINKSCTFWAISSPGHPQKVSSIKRMTTGWLICFVQLLARLGMQSCTPFKTNSQSLEDTQVGYIWQKYTLDNCTLEKYTLENQLSVLHFEKIYAKCKSAKAGGKWCGEGGKWCGAFIYIFVSGEGPPRSKIQKKCT